MSWAALTARCRPCETKLYSALHAPVTWAWSITIYFSSSTPAKLFCFFSKAMSAGFLKLLEVSHPFWEASDLFIYCVSWRFLFGIFILFSFFSILFFLFLFVNARLFFRFMNVFSNSRTLSFKTHKLFSYSSTFIRILELFSTAWIY